MKRSYTVEFHVMKSRLRLNDLDHQQKITTHMVCNLQESKTDCEVESSSIHQIVVNWGY